MGHSVTDEHTFWELFDISLINWVNILNETDAEVGDDIFINLFMQVCDKNLLLFYGLAKSVMTHC